MAQLSDQLVVQGSLNNPVRKKGILYWNGFKICTFTEPAASSHFN